MTTIAMDPTSLDAEERAVLSWARRVRRYPGGDEGWPLFKPEWEPPNIPRRSAGPVHLTFVQGGQASA